MSSVSPSSSVRPVVGSGPGRAAVPLLVAGCVLASFGVAAVAPEPAWVLLLPAAVAALWATAAVLRDELTGAAVAIVGGVLVLNVGDDTGPVQLAYIGYLVLYLALWYGQRFGHVPIVRSRLDGVAAVVLGLAVVGAGIGLVFAMQRKAAFGEALDLLPLALYFPVRDLCATRRRGAEVLCVALIVLGILTSIRTVWVSYMLIARADALWEVLRVRAAGGEVPIMTGFVLSVVALARAQRPAHIGLAMVAVGLTLVGLLLTKSRGYWVGAGAGVLVAWVAAPPAARKKMTTWGLTCLVGIALVSYVAVGDLIVTFVLGIFERMLSISSATAGDMSMLNRYRESGALWARIWESPVVGHGLGVEYSYYSPESAGTRHYSFIHNGIAALWFKQGALGFGATLALWAGGAAAAYALVRRQAAPMGHRLLALGAGAGLVANLVPAYTSSPFYIMCIVLVTTTLIGLASGLNARGAVALDRPRPA